ncbi:multicopper oxidase domain-containing protein, partial [Aurantimonas coralicida]
SIDIPVGAMRAYEFDAVYPGDWALHCHKSHHTMNAMGHDIPTPMNANKARVAAKIRQIQPDYMPMGETGMAEMSEMAMPLPDNTIPMMAGWGQFGSLEMGGMFTVMKVRDGLAADDYADPGDYEFPAGTVSYEWTGSLPEAPAAPAGSADGAALPHTPSARRVMPAGGDHSGH